MAIIGYARTSTTDQTAGLEGQKRDLLAAGCGNVIAEQVSSVAETRAGLDRALAAVGTGDTLMVTKPDRLARSTLDLLGIVRDLDARGASLILLSMGGERLDTRNPTSKLMLTILAGVATWEREIMLERQRDGIAKAKADGKYKAVGPKPMSQNVIDSVMRLSGNSGSGEYISPEAIAATLGLSRASVFRARKAHRLAQNSRETNETGSFSDDSLGFAA